MSLDLSKIKHVHFVGIGGIGISAIARMMLSQGKIVTGQDMQDGQIVNDLKKLGATITIGQSYKNIPNDVDLIVYTTAITTYDPEFFAKIKNHPSHHKTLDSHGMKTPIRSYPEMLGIVTEHKYTIAVSGTHGKTTTTAMIAKILVDTGKDPSVIVGSLLKENNSNLIIGNSEYFVVEACEYERSFLNIKPKLLVITNIESDHLDYYKDLDDIKNAFKQLEAQSEKVIRDYSEYLNKIPKLKVPGLHNRLNAAAAYAVAKVLDIKDEAIQKSLSEFSGTWRRLEKRGISKTGTIIYDDYAHHPTEIRASLEALREFYPKGEKKITVLFQPHLYSRTKALFADFAKSFSGADSTYLLPIFFAREDKDESISSEKLASAIALTGDKAKAFPDFESAEAYIKELNLGENDIFVTMGAGEAYKVADKVFHLA